MRSYLLCALIAIAPLQASAQLTEIELTNITVLADRALAVPLSKLASEYSKQHHVTVAVGYAPSFEQTLSIQDGEAADLFISAHPQSLKQLKQRGLFDINSLTPLVKAKLSLIYTGDKSKLPIAESIETYLKQPVSYVTIASPAATAEGFYAQQTLKMMPKPMPPIAQMSDTEAMLELINKSDNSFAVMFEPDALLNLSDDIISTIPESWHSEAVFHSAVIPGDNMEAARKFQNFLKSEVAQREFIKYHFYPKGSVD